MNPERQKRPVPDKGSDLFRDRGFSRAAGSVTACIQQFPQRPATILFFCLIAGLFTAAGALPTARGIVQDPEPDRSPLPGAGTASSAEHTQEPDNVPVAVLEHAGQVLTRLEGTMDRGPFWYPVCTPGGIRVTRGFPFDPQSGEPRDHPHHRSLWYAHGDVNGTDFWSGKGTIRVEQSEVESGDGFLNVGMQARWFAVDGTALLRDTSQWEWRVATGMTWCTCTIHLSSASGQVRIGDTKEGFFALRLRPEFELRPGSDPAVPAAAARNSEHQAGPDVWGQPARWVCYTATVDSRPVSVVMFDDPGNLRHPGTWHARDYGLFAANPFGMHDFQGLPAGTGDHLIRPGETLRLRYGIAIADSHLTDDQVNRLWDCWSSGELPESVGADR